MSRIPLSMLLVAALAACGTEAESREDLDSEPLVPAAAAPSAPAAQPAPTPSAPAARPAPTPVEAPVRAIPAGTVLTFEVREDVSTSSHAAGDAFSLVLVDAVGGTAGALLGAGSSARGIVTAAHSSEGSDDPALLAIRIASVEAGGLQRPVEGTVQSAVIEGGTQDSATRTAVTIAIGTAAGAAIGQILGKNTRSTVTGAAIGTAVGVGVALTTRGANATLTQGSRIILRLDRPLVY